LSLLNSTKIPNKQHSPIYTELSRNANDIPVVSESDVAVTKIKIVGRD